ncbi:hypothetical protein G6F65_019473 [Rhizopus arrhizus]|nr:hypothetical protein G6F65_019473 [Rhizopus arrhizus]
MFKQTALALALLTPLAATAAYPDKPVKIIVSNPPGGPVDVMLRVLASKLGAAWGQPVVVENRPGASGIISTSALVKSAPDGYTLVIAGSAAAVNQTLYKNVTFDLTKDFAPVALGAKVPNILVVNPQVPVKSVQELVEYAKKNPGKLAFASSGSGTSIHMAGELFKMKAGIDVLHVPYKGSAPAMTDLIGGQVQFICVPWP